MTRIRGMMRSHRFAIEAANAHDGEIVKSLRNRDIVAGGSRTAPTYQE